MKQGETEEEGQRKNLNKGKTTSDADENEAPGKEPQSDLEPEAPANVDRKELSIEELKSELDEKDKLAEEYYDRLLRIQAEFENYKKRTEKELAEYRAYANAKLIQDLLLVLDDFQNALTSDNEDSDVKYKRGFELIYKNFYGVLEREGVSEIKAQNEKFDPYKHEAVEIIPREDQPEHTVLGVVSPGYKYKDKILRPAKVQVATQPKVDEEKSKEAGKKNNDEKE
ncbi:MAG: nucleotide exchange factor GrpE [Methanomassiliicoccales archaeon]|nr:MAG: nucleotide exchange factor GrpE [Methanomassiliicoccales archaeon]